jgi:hypothetical protein
MNLVKHAGWISLAALCAGLAFAPAATAGDANLGSCIHMAKQVSQAIASAQPSTTTDKAKDEASAAQSYCAATMYAMGVAHYQKALQLLGKS